MVVQLDRVQGNISNEQVSKFNSCHNRNMPTQQEFQQLLELNSQKFAQLIEYGDLDALVESCPGWSFTQLAQHMCGTQRWSTHALLTGERGEHPQAPTQREELYAYFVEGTQQLLEASKSIDPQRPTWSFGPQPRVAEFWTRRQAHEVTIHLWDAYASRGKVYDIPNELALDGLNEIAEVFFPMRLKRGDFPALPITLALAPVGSNDVVELIADPGTDHPKVVIHGSAADLLLLLWGRIALDGFQIDGSIDSARQFLSQGVTP